MVKKDLNFYKSMKYIVAIVLATSFLASSFSAHAEESTPKFALFARLEAKPGKEKAAEDFLRGALPLAQEEAGTVTWYALRFGPSTFGIFDTFINEEGREAHLKGKIAAALMKNAPDLFVSEPKIEKIELMAAK
jgi:quinol monooxygenase YgiN